MNDYNDPIQVQKREFESKLNEQKQIIQKLYGVIVRGMVVLKYLARAGAIVATWFLLGHFEAYLLAGFVLFIGLLQLVIDKTRQVVHPDLHLSEWDVL